MKGLILAAFALYGCAVVSAQTCASLYGQATSAFTGTSAPATTVTSKSTTTTTTTTIKSSATTTTTSIKTTTISSSKSTTTTVPSPSPVKTSTTTSTTVTSPSPSATSSVTCPDNAPSTDYTCVQQASWGKCNETWMIGFCAYSCGRCPKSNDGVFNIPTTPIDTLADSATKNLYKKFVNTFGKYIISGQSETSWDYGKEGADIDYVYQQTGKYPVVRLFDLMDHYPGHPDNNAIARMKQWYADGGVVQLQWHWRAPIGVREFYSDKSSFDASKAVQSGTAENIALLADLDYAIQALKDIGVPMLWRPFHEGHGTWFWWGSKGPTVLKQLWQIMFDRIKAANVHNLIWVANFNTCTDCYPSIDYFDIISNDKYGGKTDYASHAYEFVTMANMVSNKRIIAMSENDGIPDPDSCKSENAMWSYFATWNTEYIRGIDTTYLKKVYNHALVITRDEWAGVGN
ncbi:hypothetical protein HK098_007920 [Nowakowskiella sp. JEL0407]|nr:hypothetical protein HK098_007920 [Nowakowskiella sp. JEL0407]